MMLVVRTKRSLSITVRKLKLRFLHALGSVKSSRITNIRVRRLRVKKTELGSEVRLLSRISLFTVRTSISAP
jgi:hypothetical protein